MEVYDHIAYHVLTHKNFKKYVVHKKCWGDALIELGKLFNEIEGKTPTNYDEGLRKYHIVKEVMEFDKEKDLKIEAFWADFLSWRNNVGLCQKKTARMKLTPKRKIAIWNIVRKFSSKEIEDAFFNAGTSRFLKDKGLCTIDWLCNVTNFQKVYEGNYNDEKKEFLWTDRL